MTQRILWNARPSNARGAGGGDMSERSVAEIIGWHRLDAPYGEFDDAWTRDGREWDYDDRFGDTYTVDDLLAWLLAGRAEVVDCHSYEQVDGGLGHVVTIYNDEGTDYRAPTILAALEAAVRAVAGES